MNEMNFDSLKHIKAPQEWLEKAAAIPETAVQKRSAFPLFRVAIAASIVLVSVIGLLVFLLFGNGGNMPVVVRDSGNAVTESFDDGDEVGETDNIGTGNSAVSAPKETIAVLSTDAQGNTVITYQEKPAASTSGTQPTDDRRSPSDSAVLPTSSTAPTIHYATEKPVPTEPPAEITPSPTGAHTVPDSPSTEPPLTDCRFTVTVKYPSYEGGEEPAAAVETDDPIVFCRMYDADGVLVGSSSLFTEEKRATVVSVNPDGSFVVTYDPLEKCLPITRGRYTYVMVDYHTGAELCRGSVLY